MVKPIVLIASGFALVGAPALSADDHPALDRLSKETLWEIERLGAPAIAPHGGDIVVPITRADLAEDEQTTQLWQLNEDGNVERQLTRHESGADHPAFSPDGARLAFVREVEGNPQIFVLTMDQPGEPQHLTDVPTGADHIRWIGEHVYFVSNIWPDKGWSEMAERLEADEDDPVSAKTWENVPYSFWGEWLDEEREHHLFRVPADGGEVEDITRPTGRELPRGVAGFEGRDQYDVAPDESVVAFVADSTGNPVSPDYDLFLVTPGSADIENITPENEAPDRDPLFSPDSRTLAFTRQHIKGFYADRKQLVLHDVESGEQEVITRDWDRSASGLVWAPDGDGLYGTIDDRGAVRVYYIDAETGAPEQVTQETSFSELAISDTGTLIGLNESFLQPPRVVRIDRQTGEHDPLETRNDDLLAELDLGTYESVTYEGYDGAEIQMWVHYPPAFDENREYPLFLLLHGGPHNAITDGFWFRWNAQTFASWGYVTAWHNFHGSSGFGQDFADAINPDWRTKPYADTIKASEWFADQPWIDAERMVAGGASYGGYLASVVLGKDNPFQALVIHAPVYNLYSQMAGDFPVHAERFGDFWEHDIYDEISPHTLAGNFDTPSLLIHGERDHRVTSEQGFELFRALRHRGVEARMLYFPDEDHWVEKPNNSIRWYSEVRDWVTRFAEPER